MNWIKRNLSWVAFSVLLVTEASGASSYEISRTYSTSFNQAEQPAQIYKFTDFNGRITYSTNIPDDASQVEEVSISTPPSGRYVKETRERADKLKVTADQLVEAREKREAIRAEEEKKRLEKLALLNQIKPPPVKERIVYVVNPHRFLHPHHPGARDNPKKSVQARINKRHLLQTSFPSFINR